MRAQSPKLSGAALVCGGHLRHASDGFYDVLAGGKNIRGLARLPRTPLRHVTNLLHAHDVICVRAGNNTESVNGQTVMWSAD